MTLRYVSFACLLPLVIGGAIYILFRSDTLVMFHWFQLVGLQEPIDGLRGWSEPLQHWVPEWVRYSLPDGAWVFSCTAFFVRLWADSQNPIRFFWMGIGPAMGIGGELAQIPGWMPGRFDPIDLLLCILATAAAIGLAHGTAPATHKGST